MAESNLKSQEILKELLKGNQRFIQAKSQRENKESLSTLKSLAQKGQKPKAIVLSCSDSRVPVEKLFDQDLGTLFVIRVAGNVLNAAVLGSIEFAAQELGTSLLIVLGHSSCGAVQASLTCLQNKTRPESNNLAEIVSTISPHIEEIFQNSNLSETEKVQQSVEIHTKKTVEELAQESPVLDKLLSSGALTAISAVLDLASGEIRVLD